MSAAPASNANHTANGAKERRIQGSNMLSCQYQSAPLDKAKRLILSRVWMATRNVPGDPPPASTQGQN